MDFHFSAILGGVKDLIAQLKAIIHRVHLVFQTIVDAVKAVGKATKIRRKCAKCLTLENIAYFTEVHKS